MSGFDENDAVPLASAPVTAVMTDWLTLEDMGEECLFGYATQHPTTGGLSWVRSTPIVEFSPAADRARTLSGRVYALGRQISVRELSEEGSVVLLLFVSQDEYSGRGDDLAWVTSQKMARHLGLPLPPRNPAEVARFMARHLNAYLLLRRGLG